MGQAAVDLPDPLEPGAAKGNADDLLAQLAGEEVDRLLAEADLDASTRQPPPPPMVMPEVGDSKAPSVASSTPSAEPVSAAPAAALAVSTAQESHAQALADELEADEAIHGKHRAATTTIGDLAAAAPSTAVDEVDEVDAPLPALVRPLEWLNAPLALLPDFIRETIGKIALLTLFNAIAVIVYVLIFRKHGH